MTQVPIAEGMLDLGAEDGPRMLASRCGACGALAYPVASGCARCGSVDQETIRLSSSGTIWTWTSQEFRPITPPYAGPGEFEPYYVGFVEVPEGLCVETRLTGYATGSKPAIGDPVTLVALPFTTNDGGDEVVLPAFAPVPASGGTDA
jgi:uncharacterized OB-fold protein